VLMSKSAAWHLQQQHVKGCAQHAAAMRCVLTCAYFTKERLNRKKVGCDHALTMQCRTTCRCVHTQFRVKDHSIYACHKMVQRSLHEQQTYTSSRHSMLHSNTAISCHTKNKPHPCLRSLLHPCSQVHD
jgi:hypothetical protein